MDAATSTLKASGWRRSWLARAMLQDADVLLMDEPTNHLDAERGPGDQVCRASKARRPLSSHDSKFLDNVCSHMIELTPAPELGTFKGNHIFVATNPHARLFLAAGVDTGVTFPTPATSRA